MKFIVVLLIVVNVFLLSWWTGWINLWDSREPDRLRKQVDAERITVQGNAALVPPAAKSAGDNAAASGAAPASPAAPAATDGATDKAGAAATGSAAPANGSTPTSAGSANGAAAVAGAGAAATATTTATTAASGTSPAADTAKACLEFPAMEADKAQVIEASMKQAGLSVESNAQESASSFMVLLPPSESTKEAQRKLSELKRLGVTDAFLMQDGQYKLGISLGVFRSEEGAKSLVQQLIAKGIRSARIAPVGAARASKTVLKATGTEAQLTRVRQAATEVNLNLKACAN